MVGLRSTGLMKMRLIRSKLRKREDSSMVSAVESHHHHHNHHQQQNQNSQQYHQNLQQVVHQNGTGKGNRDSVLQQNNQQQGTNINNSSVWVFPPLPPQPNIYSVNQLALMQANQDHKHGFKGLKRQLSGRFKRLISRKPNEPPTPTIPPELKPQLKTIFVY